MQDKAEEVVAAYEDLVDDIVDTTNDPEARVADGSVGEVVSAAEWLKNPEKYAQPAPLRRNEQSPHDPLGLGRRPEPKETQRAVERGPESVAAEECRYIRQAIQNVGAAHIRTSQADPRVIEHMRKLLSPAELARVEFVTKLESNTQGARRDDLDALFRGLR